MEKQEQKEARINSFFRDTFNTDALYRGIEQKDYFFLHCIRECAINRDDGHAMPEELMAPNPDKNKVYLSELAETMNLKMPEISKTIGHLEEKGYLQWETDTKIGKTYVILSDNALEVMDREYKQMKDCYERIVEEIDADELKGMVQTLKKIREIMKR
ncbi:MAG: MarR family transcriptional regulator [Lachnospiraceae bacterium]|nr:MarR family transcriptional regulator [Lachnospiraceae bacterium]